MYNYLILANERYTIIEYIHNFSEKSPLMKKLKTQFRIARKASFVTADL